MLQHFLAQGVPVRPNELAEVPAHGFTAALGEPGIVRQGSFRGAGSRNNDAVKVKVLVLNEAAQVTLDAAHLKTVVAKVFQNHIGPLFKVNVAGGIGFNTAADNLFLIARRAIHKGRQTADIVGQRFRSRNLVQASVLLKDVSRQDYINLAESRPGVDSLDVVVDKVAVGGRNYGIQPQALVNDGSLDVPAVHLLSLLPATGIEALGYRVGIVLNSIAAGHAVLRGKVAGHFRVQDSVETFVCHLGGVGLERIQVRDIPLDEQFQQAHVDEAGAVRHDAGQILLILLVSAQLSFAIFGAGDDDLLQIQRIAQNVHPGIEPELPGFVLHVLGHADLELDVHFPVAFSHIPEAGFHNGGIDDVGCHHLTVFILDGLHNDEFATVIVMDYQRVGPGHLKQFHLLDSGFLDQADGRLHLLSLDPLNLTGASATLSTKQRN